MFIDAPADSPDTARIYQSCAASEGFVMNFIRAWAWRPDVIDGFAALRAQLSNGSALSKRDLAVLVCATASEVGDSYCCLAWGRTLSAEADAATAGAVISNRSSDLAARDQALAEWARKVVRDPNAIAPADVESLREVGLGEREIFEATVFAAFRLAFSTVNDALGIGPDRELAEQVPPEVLAAITFGRKASDD